jgi:hypothetical protein
VQAAAGGRGGGGGGAAAAASTAAEEAGAAERGGGLARWAAANPADAGLVAALGASRLAQPTPAVRLGDVLGG